MNMTNFYSFSLQKMMFINHLPFHCTFLVLDTFEFTLTKKSYREMHCKKKILKMTQKDFVGG